MVDGSLHGDRKRLEILQAGVALWREGQENDVTARGIGNRVGLTHAGVLHHFGSSADLKQAVAEYAVKTKDSSVIPKLIVAKHPAAESLTPAERQVFLSQI